MLALVLHICGHIWPTHRLSITSLDRKGYTGAHRTPLNTILKFSGSQTPDTKHRMNSFCNSTFVYFTLSIYLFPQRSLRNLRNRFQEGQPPAHLQHAHAGLRESSVLTWWKPPAPNHLSQNWDPRTRWQAATWWWKTTWTVMVWNNHKHMVGTWAPCCQLWAAYCNCKSSSCLGFCWDAQKGCLPQLLIACPELYVANDCLHNNMILKPTTKRNMKIPNHHRYPPTSDVWVPSPPFHTITFY